MQIRYTLFIAIIFLTSSCGNSSAPSSTVGNSNSFGASNPFPVSDLADEVQDFDDQLEKQQDNQPEPVTQMTETNNHQIQSVVFLEGGESTTFPIPAQYECTDGGSWSKEGGNLSTTFLNLSCTASVFFDETSADSMNTNDLIATLTFTGLVSEPAENKKVQLTYIIEARRAPVIASLPTPPQVANPGQAVQFAQQTQFTIADEGSLVPDSELPSDEISEPAKQLTTLAQQRKQIALGDISSFQNISSVDREHLLIMDKSLGSNAEAGPIVWHFRLPTGVTWIEDSIENEICEILHNKSAFGLPNVQSQLVRYADRDPDNAEYNGLFCPLELVDVNYETGVLKIVLHTFDPQGLSNRRALAGLNGYLLEKGKGNNLLRLSFLLTYETETGTGKYLFENVLKLNSLQQNPVKLANYEVFASSGACQYLTTRGAVPMTHPFVKAAIEKARQQAGSEVDVSTVVIGSEAESNFVQEKIEQHFGRKVNFWINLNDGREEGVWDVLLKEFTDQVEEYEPPYLNWIADTTQVSGKRDCGFIHGVGKHSGKMNDAQCHRSRLRHVIEVCPSDSATGELPIGILE